MVRVEVIETTGLGDRSYVAHDGRVAVVIDPQRDLDRVQQVLDQAGVRCVLVVETHIHNDYVSGGYQLARAAGADYAVSAHDPVNFDRLPVHDGQTLTVGSMSVRILGTPGHTDHHLSYVVSDGNGPPAAFTGGSLLYGTVGRTDLVSPERTEDLTRAQFRSARALAETLPDDAHVYPTHGFGSMCAASSAGQADRSTIGEERAGNDALTVQDEDAFVERLIAGLGPYPAYYAHMGVRNQQGPGPVDLTEPEMLDAEQLRASIRSGQWVVDLRDRTAYAADHVAGTIGIELGGQFLTWLGWLIPWGTPVTLIGANREQVADAQRQLVRIGIDRPAGQAVGAPSELASEAERRRYPMVTFEDLARERRDGIVVLDVRQDGEWTSSHIPGAVHIPLQQLLVRLAEVPQTQLWVHCGSGYRASIAASLLDRAGHDVVCINDTFGNAEQLGLTGHQQAGSG